MRIESVEWDDGNAEHATRHGVSVSEIEQAIANAAVVRRNKRGRPGDVRIDSVTDGGRRVVVIAVHDAPRRSLRPITAWEA
jgi:uncharacterized DUF497 family protein